MAFTTETAKLAGQKSKRTGIKNNVNQKIKGSFQLLLNNNLEQLQKDLDNMSPAARFNSLMKLAEFTLPKLRATELKTDIETFQPVIISLGSGKRPDDAIN